MSEDVCTLAEQYAKFSKGCIPDDAPSYQRRDMKRSFYAGSAVMLMTMLDLNELDEEQARKCFDALEKEIDAFCDEVHIEALLHMIISSQIIRVRPS